MGGVDSLSIPLRVPSRRTGTRDDAKNGPDAHRLCCVSRGPGRSTKTWLGMALRVRAFISVVPRSIMVCGGAFFLALTTLLTLIIHGNIKNVKLFLRKIVKMFTINHILHEFRFFVTVFLRKIVKTVTFTRKIDKNFKTGVILAHFDFFVKLFAKKKIPDDSVVLISVVCDRLISNRSRSGDLDLQRMGFTVARGPVPRERSIQTKNACSTEAMDVF